MHQTQMLHILNLPEDITNKELFNLFSEYGQIIIISIGNRYNTIGSAFVVYSNIKSAVRAEKSMNGYWYKNNVIDIVFYQPFSKVLSCSFSKI